MALPTNLAFVTVMDVSIYNETVLGNDTWTNLLGTIECLTISNITQEGPRKEARGGREAKPCIRYGKTMRLEMEDVVMRKSLMNAFFGADIDTADTVKFTDTFAGQLKIVGTTYVVDNSTGERQEATITFNNFLPDSVMNITMESEGDIGMISLAGELFADDDGNYFVITG